MEGTMKPVKVILRKGKRENNGGDSASIGANVTMKPPVQLLCIEFLKIQVKPYLSPKQIHGN
jgi:hypothetical protein